MYKKIVTTFLIVIGLSIAAVAQNNISAGSQITDKNIKHHIVIQLSSNDSLVWKALMNNVKHLLDEWQGNVQIEVVSHGPGIEMMMTAKTTQQNKMAELKKSGVVFAACENTLKARNLTKGDIIPEAVFVHSGVVEIVMKQEQGWSYLKAGF